MADSPLTGKTDLLTYSIFSAGSEIDGSYQMLSLQVTKEVNRIPFAIITFVDGDPALANFPLSNKADFVPGTEIEIKAGYHSQDNTIFKGIVIRHGLRVGSAGAELVVECRDASVKMTVGRKNAFFLDSKDSDILSKIIGSYSGITADVGSTSAQHKEVVQYYSTDWDFVLTRAEANGLLAIADDGKLSIKAPDSSSSAVLSIEYGDSMLEFRADMDARTQLSSVQASAWDMASQALFQSSGANPSVSAQGNISASTLASVIGANDYALQSPAALQVADLKAWADGQMLRSWMSKITGLVKFQGNATVKPGTVIQLQGVGDRFNGNAYVNAVTHAIEGGTWVTTAGIGLSAVSFAEQSDVTAPAASGLLPGVKGLQIGVVKQIDQDKDGEFRVLVKIPLMQKDSDGVWARLSSYYATSGAGNFFYPEENDEVVMGFLNEDPCFPVIIGMLYSSSHSPAYTPDKKNPKKAIVTKSQLKVEFDDENKVITIQTPGNNIVTISDKDKSITLADQNSNKIEMTSSGITISSAKDVNIKATGKIVLDATNEVDITAQADVKVTGLNVTQTANIGFTAKGNATAEISATGSTTVKGGMVMIN
jgi:Rhs element Vgr protein